MLISKVPDNDGGMGESVKIPDEETDSHEYHTANELFELMTKNQNLDGTDVDKLTTRDLVLLYKNIDLGTKLMSNANEIKCKKPNQHVESIVYNDEPESEDSDVTDIFSNEDLHNVFLINDERLDLLNTPLSVENTLCHKLGDLEIQISDLSTEYDKHFLFKDPYIKEQLKSLRFMTNSSEIEDTVLPASLLDYICCKRLEDNYNFYMDNIIRYVKHTIEQLKRISNGDYLTDKAKEKWREVENSAEDCIHANTKILATSTSIPLHVERKIGGRKSTWDDIVHSAVDVRSLSKILEKKIIVEVPKLICGAYKIFSKCCTDNLIISCKKDNRPVDETVNAESRVDVVFQMQRSETGQVISNINSIMILQTAPVVCDSLGPEILPLPLSLPLSLPPYQEQANDNRFPEKKVKIIELEPIIINEAIQEVSVESECNENPVSKPVQNSFLDTIDFEGSEDNDGTASLKNSSYHESSVSSSNALRHVLDRKFMLSQREPSCDVIADDLRMTLHKLTIQSALTEESGEEILQSTSTKKKSPTRVRIKSPYENQSYILEEKKRRKLLEIRERRERKKLALVENCKIAKHKYGKGAIIPQSASSVTKLSISNKSFYNSIYGQSTNVDPSKQAKGRNRKGGKRELDLGLECYDGENDSAAVTPDRNSKKSIDRSYYLDDAVTEMTYINIKRNENDSKDLCSTSNSVLSNDSQNNLNLLSQLSYDEISHEIKNHQLSTSGDGDIPEVLHTSKSILNIVPSNSPNIHDNPKKLTSSVECRKSIDKIYNLMRMGKTQETEKKSIKSKKNACISEKVDENEGHMSSTCPGSDSGTSLKHHLTSSNPSCFSFDKNNNEKPINNYNQRKPPGSMSAIVPKVIISSKSSTIPKSDLEKNKKDLKRSVASPKIKVQDNPLKAISQLLHEFENVQKTRQKPNMEHKSAKKPEIVPSDGKNSSKQSSLKRRSRLDQHNEVQIERNGRVTTPKEKKPKQYNGMDIPKIPYQQIAVDEKHPEKIPKKKITDILDEAKEARGEAVRGPSKLNSRLNSLAQPKRIYVQAHSEEYQTKYGKTLMADRLQRLAAASPPLIPAERLQRIAAASPPLIPDRNGGSANSRNKFKRSGIEAVSAVSVKRPSSPVSPLDRVLRTRHSPSTSTEIKEWFNQGAGPSYKQNAVPETPQTLMKKMVAVESYVNNHYGRATSTSAVNQLQGAQKLRVPLLPTDIRLASSKSSPPIEESPELGSRLQHIINTLIKTTSQGLEVLTECHESNSKISKENTDDYSLTENLSRSERVSSDSEYTVDVLDDNNVITSVEKIDKPSAKDQEQTDVGDKDASQYDLQYLKSVTELEKLENSISHHISVGTFQKRLWIKNLAMTPKPSIKQLFVLQSGDTGSLIVQTPIAQSIKESKVNFSDLADLPGLSKSNIEWTFANFPMQISTVGYAFPDYKLIQRGSTSLVQLFDQVSKSSKKEKHLITCRKTHHETQYFNSAQHPHPLKRAAQTDVSDAQYFKSAHHLRLCEQTAQTDVSDAALAAAEISSKQVMELEKKDDIKQSDSTDTKPKHVFIDFSVIKQEEGKLKDEHKGTDILAETKENDSTTVKPDEIEYTTSLDILVGLLNEIQNITTCQTEMTNSDKNNNENQQSKELQTILNTAVALDHSIKSSPCDAVSFTSLDRLRQLDSTASLYSFYLSDNEESEKGNSKLNYPSDIIPLTTNELLNSKRIYADKEVSVDFIEREVDNKYTDIPSQIFPLGMNHMTNSLIGVLSKPSRQSMFSFAECHSISSLCHTDVIEIPQKINTKESNQSLAFNDVSSHSIIKANENKSYKKKIESYEKVKLKKRGKVNKVDRLKTEFDPIMKMKRDILVTVYSILVFTVFAALSFPEMMYRL